MILRKPYAFLIKYFKIIHIIMFGMFVYFVFALRKIHTFFVGYVKTGNFTYLNDMARNYISPILFIFAILIAISAILIFLLMRKKQKPVLFYRILIVYSIFLLVALTFYTSFFVSLSNTTYAPLNVVIYRDIIAFLYYINYLFVGFTFIRGFGFDIKKFSFDRDKKELNLNEEDNEEFEVGLQLDKENVVAYLNREKRELKYYIKENALILTIIGIVLLVITSMYLYNYFFVTNKVYKQSDDIIENDVKYHVNNVYITRHDKYGSFISSDYTFVITDINIHNLDKTTLDKENFRIQVGNNYYYPVYNYYSSFDDLGEGYTNKTLKENTNKDYILVFRTDRQGISANEEVYLEILKSKSSGVYTYNKMLIKSNGYNINVTPLKMGENLTIDDNKLLIESYEFQDKASYQYEETIGNKTYQFTKNVKPNMNDILMVLKVTSDDNLPKDFIKNYFGLVYDKQELPSKDFELIDQNEDTYYFSVPKRVKFAKNLYIKIGTRVSEYDVILKEG